MGRWYMHNYSIWTQYCTKRLTATGATVTASGSGSSKRFQLYWDLLNNNGGLGVTGTIKVHRVCTRGHKILNHVNGSILGGTNTATGTTT